MYKHFGIRQKRVKILLISSIIFLLSPLSPLYYNFKKHQKNEKAIISIPYRYNSSRHSPEHLSSHQQKQTRITFPNPRNESHYSNIIKYKSSLSFTSWNNPFTPARYEIIQTGLHDLVEECIKREKTVIPWDMTKIRDEVDLREVDSIVLLAIASGLIQIEEASKVDPDEIEKSFRDIIKSKLNGIVDHKFDRYFFVFLPIYRYISNFNIFKYIYTDKKW